MEAITQKIKEKAQNLGFISCGISKAEFLEDEAIHLENWLKSGFHGKMNYMENYFDIRLNPKLLVDDAKSVISLAYTYYPKEKQRTDSYKISKYAYGKDYHKVVKDKLHELLQLIKELLGDVNARVFVDSAPVLEHAWAEKSGIGWIGKNGLTLSKQKGSFFFLSEIILDVKLKYDNRLKTDHCGTCTKCIDACPTNAIIKNKVVDGSKCISYFTIELKEKIPENMQGKFKDWIFGCDICQDVCPWNRFSKPHLEPKFNPDERLISYTKKEWEEITEETFNEIFKESAVRRTKFEGFKRNIEFVKNSSI